MGICQKRLGSNARWWNTQIKVKATQVHEQMGHSVQRTGLRIWSQTYSLCMFVTEIFSHLAVESNQLISLNWELRTPPTWTKYVLWIHANSMSPPRPYAKPYCSKSINPPWVFGKWVQRCIEQGLDLIYLRWAIGGGWFFGISLGIYGPQVAFFGIFSLLWKD